jgi:hypothetical protein
MASSENVKRRYPEGFCYGTQTLGPSCYSFEIKPRGQLERHGSFCGKRISRFTGSLYYVLATFEWSVCSIPYQFRTPVAASSNSSLLIEVRNLA